MYTVDYFIRKFEAIPEWRWCVGLINGPLGTHCALGHCTGNDSFPFTGEADSLARIFRTIEGMTSYINNGDDHRYKQETPKQRILAALYDIKRMQNPEQPEEKPAKKEYRVIKVSKTLFDHNLIEAN